MDKDKRRRGFAPSQSTASATSLKAWRDLVKSYEEVVAKRDEAFTARMDAAHAAFKAAEPPAILKFRMFIPDRGWRLDATITSDRDAVRYMASFAPNSPFAPKYADIRPALIAHKQAQADAEVKHNVKALTEAHTQLAEEAREARARLMSAPAPDMDALAYKLRVAMTMFDDVFDPYHAGDTKDVLESPSEFAEGSAMLAIYFDTLLLNGRADEVSKVIGAAKAYVRSPMEEPERGPMEPTPDHRDDDGFSAREWINAFLAAGGVFAYPEQDLAFVAPTPQTSAVRSLLDELRADPSKKEAVVWNLTRFGIHGQGNVTQAWINAREANTNGGK